VLHTENRPVNLILRLFAFFELAILFVAGIAIYFFPSQTRPIWPWTIAPFNAAFVGAIYLASIPGISLMAVSPRWSTSRFILLLSLTFTSIGLAASLINLSQFDFQRWTAWFWFFIYVSLPVNSAVQLWLYRGKPVLRPISLPPAWRYYLAGQGIVLLIYGAGQVLLPDLFSSFWPWVIDRFHSQIYGGAFITSALGGLLISRRAARFELLSQSTAQFGFGFFALLGLFAVDIVTQRVAWTESGTWVWIGAFAVLMTAGFLMLLLWSSIPRPEMQD